jgi:hypothetical protein
VVEFPNPIARTVFLRQVGPLFPVWLFGVVLIITLDRFSGVNAGLPNTDLGVLLLVYSVFVGGLASLLYYREWRRSPSVLQLSVDGLRGWFAERPQTGLAFAYGEILRVHPAGYFAARVEARPETHRSVDWINLTNENAARVLEAWGAWQERRSSGG